MKIIDRHIGVRVLLTTLLGVGVLSLVLVLGNVMRELLDLIINRNLPLSSVILFMVLALPFSLTFTIPWGFLTALLLVFGKMSAENELVALRASGVSMFRICAPVFILALSLSALCFWMSAEAAPLAKQRMLSLVTDLATADPLSLFKPGEVIDRFPNRRISVDKNEGGKLKNIIIFEMNEAREPVRMITAREGRLARVPNKSGWQLQYFQARFEERDKADPSNLTRIRAGLMLNEGTYQLPLDDAFQSLARRRKTLSYFTLSDLAREGSAGTGEIRLKAAVEFQKRVSIALACMAFALIGVPLAITAHRQETSAGFALSLAVAFAYFFLIVLAQMFDANPQAHPVFLVWLPNILFGFLGIFLFARLARR